MSVLDQLGRIIYSRVRNIIENHLTTSTKIPKDNFQGKTDQEEFDWEEKFSGEDTPRPDPLTEDLSLFDLSPPSSLRALRKRRNELLRKYHPDRYHGNFTKEQKAKEMTQIYNEAYERLIKKF